MARADLNMAETRSWERICRAVLTRLGRPEVRAGRARYSCSELIAALPHNSDERTIIEGAMQGKRLTPSHSAAGSRSGWLMRRLMDASYAPRWVEQISHVSGSKESDHD